MIILTNPLLLEIVLGSSATTSQLPFYVAYVDSTSITYVPAQLNGLTNNTSIVTLVPTPLAGTSRTIKYVSIHNEDSVSSQVILQINDGVNTKIIVNFTLDSGDRLEYTDTVGFRCLTSTGEVKQGSGGGGIVYPGAGIPISTGTGWSTSITDNSTNWNTAYGWGNHASAGYLTGITSGQVTTALGYTPVTNARTLTINGTTYDLSANRSWTISAGTTYTFSTGLNDNAGTVTSNLSTGVSGGQSVIGGTASGNNLTLSSTSNATKGKILFGTSAYDEVNNRFGLRTTSPGSGAIYIQSSGAEVEDGITWSNGARIGYFTAANATIEAVTGGSLMFKSKNQTGLRLSDNSGNQAFSFAMVDQTTTTNQTIVFGGDYSGGYRSVGTTVAGIDRNGSTLSFFANSGAAGSYASFTPNKILSIDGANSRVGIGQSSPTAVLHLKAGTATANTAPLKFTTGTNLTTAEAGVMEYNNTFHLTNSDATRRHIVTAPNTTKVTAAAPYTNDGYITVNIGGTDFKLMTTA